LQEKKEKGGKCRLPALKGGGGGGNTEKEETGTPSLIMGGNGEPEDIEIEGKRKKSKNEFRLSLLSRRRKKGGVSSLSNWRKVWEVPIPLFYQGGRVARRSISL